jgi:ketosteroid isomerase-like protein
MTTTVAAVLALWLIAAGVGANPSDAGPPISTPDTAQSPVSPAPALPSVTLPPELARVLTDYEKAWASRDAKGLAALFADDGFVLSTNTPPVRGRANIERHYGRAGGSTLLLRALAYASSGDVGYIIGAYRYGASDPDTGKFTLTLTKGADGRWLIVSDMDNGNVRRP